MVRGKKGRKSVTNVQDMQDSRAADSPEKNTGRRQRFAFWEYVLVCIFFILFCYLQKYVAFKILRGAELEELALNFFFDTLWKGFVIVAFLVWLHDFFYKDVEDNIP